MKRLRKNRGNSPFNKKKPIYSAFSDLFCIKIRHGQLDADIDETLDHFNGMVN